MVQDERGQQDFMRESVEVTMFATLLMLANMKKVTPDAFEALVANINDPNHRLSGDALKIIRGRGIDVGDDGRIPTDGWVTRTIRNLEKHHDGGLRGAINQIEELEG